MVLKADKSSAAPEVDKLLSELGNEAAAIPYFGLFQPGEEPIHFPGVYYTSQSFLDQLGADQLSEAWGKPKETIVKQKTSSQIQRVSRLPEATAN